MEAKMLEGSGANRMIVRMFGGFSIEYNGSPVTFSRGSSAKFIKLLQQLFLNLPQGVSKNVLIDALYDRDSGVNNNKNLNNVIYRAKKQLTAAGLPEEDYIILENGICRWNSSFPVEVDAVCFEKTVKNAFLAEGSSRKLQLTEAEALYSGEFLPAFSTELWVITRNVNYRKQYGEVVEALCGFFAAEGDLNGQLELYRKAAKIYPYDEWQLKEMDCLIGAKEYKTAYALYQETARLYCEELGLPPGPEMLNRLQLLERQMRYPVGSFEDIKETLKKKEPGGAYYCLYPGFLDSCRLLARTEERTGKSVFLMLLNLTAGRGKEFQNQEKLETQMSLLKQVIRNTFRQGDLFTTYSKSQYVIILIGTERENCGKAFDRCLNRWKNTEGASGELSYSVESLLKMVSPELVKQDKKPEWGKNRKKWDN